MIIKSANRHTDVPSSRPTSVGEQIKESLHPFNPFNPGISIFFPLGLAYKGRDVKQFLATCVLIP
jgi:hypothetical protein